MPVPAHLWQARAGLDRRVAEDPRARAAAWGLVDVPDLRIYPAICDALAARMRREPAWVAAIDALLTGRLPGCAALPTDLRDTWRELGVLDRDHALAWEALAAAAPHLDFTPPLLACLLGRHDPAALRARAAGLELRTDGAAATLRARIFRALSTLEPREMPPDADAAARLFGALDRAGAPMANAPDLPPTLAARLFDYPAPGAEPVCLPLEVADALAPRRLAVLDVVLAEAVQRLRAGAEPVARHAPGHDHRVLPLRAAALRLMCPEAPEGPPASQSAGARDLARATRDAPSTPPLIDRGPEALIDHHLRRLLGPLDPTRDTLGGLVSVEPLVTTLGAGRGLVAAADGGRAALDAIGRDLQRLLSRAQWAVLDLLARLGPVELRAEAPAHAVALASARGIAAGHRDRWSLAAHLPSALVPPAAGALLATRRDGAAAAHLDALTDRVLGPLDLAHRRGSRLVIDGAALGAALARIRDGVTVDDPTPAPRFALRAGGGLAIDLPATTRLGPLAELARAGRLDWHPDHGWRARLSPDRAVDPASGSLLSDLRAHDSTVAGWMTERHGPPRITRLDGFTAVESATPGELEGLLARLPPDAGRRLGPRLALIRTAALDRSESR